MSNDSEDNSVIRKLIIQLLYVVSMPITAELIILGYSFYKTYLMPVPHPSQLELKISEIAFRSNEVVTQFWEKYHKCPMAQDIELINLLPLVANVTVTQINTMSCKLIIQLKKDNIDTAVAGKTITQTYRFKALSSAQRHYQWKCYTDAAKEVAPSVCQQNRNIEFYLDQ